jgi:hypothetical protein
VKSTTTNKCKGAGQIMFARLFDCSQKLENLPSSLFEWFTSLYSLYVANN